MQIVTERRGKGIFKYRIKTPISTMQATFSQVGLYALDLGHFKLNQKKGCSGNASGIMETVEFVDLIDPLMDQECRAGDWARTTNQIGPIANQLAHDLNLYFTGEAIQFSIPLDWSGYTPFQRRVLTAAGEIPWGTTRSYREVAEIIGNYRACRAVGQALGVNRFPLLIPCHRVITSQRTLGGFTGGLEWKRWLLELEGVLLDRPPRR